MAAVALLAPPARSRRLVVLRLAAGPALGQVGPFGVWAFPLVYVIVPIVAAVHLRIDGREAFLRDEVPRLVEGLGWVLALQAWAASLVDRFPLPLPERVLRVEVRPEPPPAAALALARLVTGLPAGVALWLAGALALPLWLASLVCLLVAGRQPAALQSAQRALLGANARFLVAHASIV